MHELIIKLQKILEKIITQNSYFQLSYKGSKVTDMNMYVKDVRKDQYETILLKLEIKENQLKKLIKEKEKQPFSYSYSYSSSGIIDSETCDIDISKLKTRDLTASKSLSHQNKTESKTIDNKKTIPETYFEFERLEDGKTLSYSISYILI